jgi:hypothetical protein
VSPASQAATASSAQPPGGATGAPVVAAGGGAGAGPVAQLASPSTSASAIVAHNRNVASRLTPDRAQVDPLITPSTSGPATLRSSTSGASPASRAG